MSKLFEAILRPMMRIADNSILTAIRNSFIITLPLVMAGSLAVLINNLPIPVYQDFMIRLFGPSWRNIGEFVTFGTFSVMSMIVGISVAYNIAIRHNQLHPFTPVNPLIAAMVGFAALLTMMYPKDSMVSIFQWAGVSGLFVSMLVSVSAAIIFTRLSLLKSLALTFYAEDADFSTPNAMAALFPAIITVLIFSLLRGVFAAFNVTDIFQFTYHVMQMPFQGAEDGIRTAFLYVLVLHVFWIFGIHGANVIDPVTNDIYKTAIAENIQLVAAGEAPTHIFTKPFFDVFVFPGGAGATISLLIVLLIFARRSSTRRVGQLSALPALFNINEMLTFGLPIVLNPFFIIPFIAVPIVMGVSSYIFTAIGILPYTVADVAWTTPPLINAYAATGSVVAVFVQLFNIALGVVIYIPFVFAYERMKENAFKATYTELIRISIDGESDVNKNILLAREDSIGAAARMFANDLKLALTNKELYLEYQPQVNVLTGKVYGVEALLRWKHKQYGMVPPPLTVTVAEDSDLINELGYWVIDEATTQLAEWKAMGINDVRVSVNVSVKQLADTALPEKIALLLANKGLKASDLEIEVTESIALSASTTLNKTLQQIHKIGVNIAVDDFGMGHSSLLYLRQFPVDVLKLDASLSKDVLIDPNIVEIIATIEKMCKTLKIEMIVEHVETAPQLEALVKLGAENIQGYFFSKPLLPEAFQNYVQASAGGIMPDYLPGLKDIHDTHTARK